MKTHHVWWPHLDHAPIFNPYVSPTKSQPSSDRIDLPNLEEEDFQDEDDEASVEREDRPRVDR